MGILLCNIYGDIIACHRGEVVCWGNTGKAAGGRDPAKQRDPAKYMLKERPCCTISWKGTLLQNICWGETLRYLVTHMSEEKPCCKIIVLGRDPAKCPMAQRK